MLWKATKAAILVTGGAALLGGVVFGGDLMSYARSSAGAVRSAVKDSVPIEFELRRARDMLGQIIPQMHENVRRIAQEEVEIEALKKDLAESEGRIRRERNRIEKLRGMLETSQDTFRLEGRAYTRSEIRTDLARRLERVKQARTVLESKQEVLQSRKRALAEARDSLDRTRSQKALLEEKLEGLVAKHRMLESAKVGSKLAIDDSKLAKSRELITGIRERLNVAEKVMAHESRFVQEVPVDGISEQDLLNRVDRFLGQGQNGDATSGNPGDATSGHDAPQSKRETQQGGTDAAASAGASAPSRNGPGS